jgi:hypothetical protein
MEASPCGTETGRDEKKGNESEMKREAGPLNRGRLEDGKYVRRE